MALKGDLASVDLAQVFQMLALNQKVGLLGIQSPGSWKALYFDHRGVTLYFNEHTMLDRVLARMTRTGVLMEESVEEAREHAAKMGTPVVESLLAGGYLSEEELERGIHFEMEEEIYDLFFWQDAKFEFFESTTSYEGHEGIINDRFFFSTDMLIMEAARRIDEWGYIESRVPSALEIHQQAGNGASVMDLSEAELQVYELIDGRRNVSRLIEVTGMASFHTYKSLATLIDEGAIEAVPSEELLPTGQECFREGRLQDAINLFEKAVSETVGVPEVHDYLAEAYEAIGEYELGAYHAKCMAEFRAAEGKAKDAIDLFRRVLSTLPTDLEAQQRVVELTVGHPEFKTDDFDPLVVGKDLVDLYLEIGEIERVRGILEGLLRNHPSDLELKKSLINVHTKAGDTKRVIELYESIANDLVKSGDPIAAIKYLQKIMMLDRSRKHVSERIKSLYQLEERRRSRRRSLIALSLIFCLIMAAGVGYYFYDLTARKYYEKLDLSSLIVEKNYKGAIKIIDSFLAAYPFTMVGAEAEAERKNLQAMQQAYDAEVERERQGEEEVRERLRHQYQFAWQLYEAYFAEQNLTAALEELETVRKLVVKVDQPKDRRWAEEIQVEKNFRELKKYLGDAAALDRRVRKALDAGDWRAARKNALTLITDFDYSEQARHARVPVRLDTRPPGARILQEGKPLTRLEEGQRRHVLTPAVVYCPNVPKAKFELRKDGFENLVVSISPTESESARFILSAVPDATVTFSSLVQTGIGVSPSGLMVVGLQGGKIGFAWMDKSRPNLISKLDGLSDMAGVPAVTSNRVIFRTMDRKIVCHNLLDGALDWSIRTRHSLTFDPVVAANRVFLADKEGRIYCLEATSGREIWVKAIGGQASGKPFVARRKVMIGSQSGGVLVLDATDGRVVTEIPAEVGVTTPVLLCEDYLIFGTSDGRVTAHRADNRARIWSVDVGRAVRDTEMAYSPEGRSIIVMGKNNTLLRIRLGDGKELGRKKLEWRLRSGPVVVGMLVYVALQEKISAEDERSRYRGLLQALDSNSFDLQWEFKDEGEFRSPLAASGPYLFVTGSKGEVYRFHRP